MLDELFDMIAQSQSGNQEKSPAGSQDLIGSLLEGMFGGPSQAGSGPTAPGAQDMAGLGGILEMIMGGMSGAGPTGRGSTGGIASNPMLMPFTEALAEKLNISPQMAAVIISAAFALLMGALKKSQASPGGEPAPLDLDELLDKDFIQSTGASAQVAQQTGMGEDEATESLQEALRMLSGTVETPEEKRPKPAAKGATKLDSLLDTWETD